MMTIPLQISKRMSILLLCAMIAAVMVGISLLCVMLMDRADGGEILLPDDAYQAPDPNAEPYPGGGNGLPLQYPEGGGAASFICEAEMQIDLAEKRIGLMFVNPAASTQDVVIALQIQGVTVAQSRRIEPGYRITEMSLASADVLMAGIYRGELRIYYYAPDTGAQTVQTIFPVTVTVKGNNH